MTKGNFDSLPHLKLEEIKYAYGPKICAYAITLEAWRRGMKVKYMTANPRSNTYEFQISSKLQTHIFNRSRGDLTSKQAIRICSNKVLTKEYLLKNGIPVPKGRRFKGNDVAYETIIKEVTEIGFPLVAKPVFGSLGKGVISNIQNEEELHRALVHIREDLNYSDIVVEKHIEGEDYRVYVVGDQVAGAIKRTPANVIGDGHHSIEELIRRKNLSRIKNPYLSKGLIKVDYEVKKNLQESGYTLSDILEENKVLYLRKIANTSAGGDTYDATMNLSPAVREIAINAIKAIPGLVQGGVDMLISEDGTGEQVGSVIEINSRAELGIHLFPVHGKAQDIPSVILDYYFPETKNERNDMKGNYLYFDLQAIHYPLREKIAEEIIIQPHPTHEIQVKQFAIRGKVQGVGYRNWVRRLARKLELSGFTENKRDGSVVVVVAGKKENIEELQKKCEVGPRRADVRVVQTSEWKKPVLTGFKVK